MNTIQTTIKQRIPLNHVCFHFDNPQDRPNQPPRSPHLYSCVIPTISWLQTPKCHERAIINLCPNISLMENHDFTTRHLDTRIHSSLYLSYFRFVIVCIERVMFVKYNIVLYLSLSQNYSNL